MEKKSSSLSLEEFFITKIDINWVPGTDPNLEKEIEELGLAFDYQLGRKTDAPNHFRLTLKVNVSPDKEIGGLLGEVLIDGYFSFPEETDEQEMQYLIRVNGCSMLYSLLRGQLALISGSFPCGKFTLPAVVMDEVVKDVEERKKAAALEQK